MELASQIFLSFRTLKLKSSLTRFLISYIPLRKMEWTVSSFFELILIFAKEWRIEKKYRTCRSFHVWNILSDNIRDN